MVHLGVSFFLEVPGQVVLEDHGLVMLVKDADQSDDREASERLRLV